MEFSGLSEMKKIYSATCKSLSLFFQTENFCTAPEDCVGGNCKTYDPIKLKQPLWDVKTATSNIQNSVF